MSNCRCSRAASEGSANVSFSFVDARWHKTKSLGQAPLAQTMLPIRWWHSRRAPSATASPRQYLPASQPFNYHDFVHRYHSRNVMPGQAEKRMRRALHPSTLYPPHSTHLSLYLRTSVPNTANDDVAAPPVPVSHPRVRAVFLPALTTTSPPCTCVCLTWTSLHLLFAQENLIHSYTLDISQD